jgi:hypothetical protein
MPNYRTNEDKLCATEFNNYNLLINVEDLSEDSGPVLEPATLQEVKDYMRLEGFNADDSPGTDMDFDDLLIEDMIVEARMWIEKFTGLHLVPKRLQVTFCNGSGNFELPGPVQGAITITGDITTAEYIGTQFPKVRTQGNEIVATYAAGYNYGTAPAWVKNAIKAYCVWAYERRGDETNLKGTPERAGAICRIHRRLSVWA